MEKTIEPFHWNLSISSGSWPIFPGLLLLAPHSRSGQDVPWPGLILDFFLSEESIVKHGLFCVILTLFSGVSTLADGRPMTIDDLLAVKTVADPQISPDGELVVYSVSEPGPGDRQDKQQSLAGSHIGRGSEAVDHRAGDQQPAPLEPGRQDH